LLSWATVSTTDAFVAITTIKSSKTQQPQNILSISSSAPAFAPAGVSRKPLNRLLACLNNAQNDDDNIRSNDDEHQIATAASTSSRRLFGSQFLTTVAAASASSFFVTPPNAWAKTSEVDEDKNKLKKGYERLTYLLDNWDRLTTVCDNSKTDPFSGKTVCFQSPLVVSEYMGYKSMADPLFKADKTMKRLDKAGQVPEARSVEFLDAAETWQQTADEAQGMAYTSSWAGPENGGGDENIAMYLDRAKKQVTDARKSLGTIIEILQV